MASSPCGLKAIAAAAGVSHATVYRALNGKRHIAEATRRHVLQVAEQLGYHPNRLARSLRTSRSFTLGLVLRTVNSSFHAELLENIEEAARAQGFDILLACSQGDPERERDLVQLFREKAADGVIVAPEGAAHNLSFYQDLVDDGLPLVFIDSYLPRLPSDYCVTDNFQSGYLVGRHLTGLGRKQTVILLGVGRYTQATSVFERVEGCRRALGEAGLAPPLVLELGADDLFLRPEPAYRGMLAQLRSGLQLDSLFVLHDGHAYPAMQALHEFGLSIPGDVAVVGHDDLEPSRYLTPALTTVRQPLEQMGAECVRLLLERLEQGLEVPPQQLRLEPTLIVRQSCGAAPETPGAPQSVIALPMVTTPA